MHGPITALDPPPLFQPIAQAKVYLENLAISLLIL
jgi:hypothetical protein